MAGKIRSIDQRGCRGWARLPDHPAYPVVVHLLIDEVVCASAIADLACDDEEEAREEALDAWFVLDLPDEALERSDELSVLIGESGEVLEPPVKQTMAASEKAALGEAGAQTAAVTYRDFLARGATFADIIDLFYLDILQRPADRSGMTHNLALLEGGKLTFDGLRTNLLMSGEYKRLRLAKAGAPGRIFNNPLVIRSSTQRRQFERHAAAFQRSPAPMTERLVHFFPGLLTRQPLLARLAAAAARGLPAREVFCRALGYLSDQPALILPDLPEAMPTVQAAPGGDLAVELPLASASFVLGWNRVENGGDGPYRWMKQVGVVLNPHPHRRVARIDVTVNGWYGVTSHAVFAASERGRLAVSRHQPAGGPCVLSIAGGETGERMASVVLVADEATSPLRHDGSYDSRVLSFSVARVVIVYKEAT